MLLIEDDAANLGMALRALAGFERGRLRIEVARDGARAIALLHAGNARRPRVVILGIDAPDYAGLELLRRLRAEPATQILPVVVLGPAAGRGALAARGLGPNSFVARPPEAPAYAQLLHDVLGYWLDVNHLPAALG